MRHTASAGNVVKALDDLVSVEKSVDRAILQALGIGPNDAAVLRHLLDLESSGTTTTTPRSLSDLLGISSAATTALIDRLVNAGWVERQPHPQDRRSVLIRATVPPGSPARRLLAVRSVAVSSAAAGLGAQERRIVVEFLDELHRAEQRYLAEATALTAATQSLPRR
ncbi:MULTISPECIES: MarR family winged helix-turn-helix transcriptional regulator [Microbacterium]|uniref:MarR family winged helix-turn-helix transcriptional regulator n=1 Tax=Microbacterium TaxID=33882 RepID=UPI001430A7A0|nr:MULTISPECIES: MarR family transcriptional regulator [Microbacterium]MCK6068327.1 MarR family transcriptional regulator [Microbacterium sp. EYE_512]